MQPHCKGQPQWAFAALTLDPLNPEIRYTYDQLYEFAITVTTLLCNRDPTVMKYPLMRADIMIMMDGGLRINEVESLDAITPGFGKSDRGSIHEQENLTRIESKLFWKKIANEMIKDLVFWHRKKNEK